MERGYLLCESANCGKTARVFGVKETLKIRSCEDHMVQFLDKKMQIFDIEGYKFVSKHQDLAVFEERKSEVAKGRENLSNFATTCESELTAALKAIESAKNSVLKSVENRFEEMKVMAIATCSEVKRQLSQLEKDFDLFLTSRESQLSPAALLACGNISVTPKFVRFGIVNVSGIVSAALNDSWAIAPADVFSTLKFFDLTLQSEAIQTTLEEVVNQAQKGILEPWQYVNSLIDEEIVLEEINAQMLPGILRFEKSKIEQDLKWVKHSWRMRQLHAFRDDSAIEVGQRLATLLYRQYGQFPEAEKILQQCHDLATRQNPVSSLSLSISNDICGVYLSSAQYQQLEQFGMRILETCGTASLPAEQYWTTLFYLTYSMRLQLKHAEANAIVENWRQRDFREESQLAAMLRFLTLGSDFAGEKEHAVNWLLQARRIGTVYFPTSYFTALTLFRLSFLSEDKLQERYHLQAQSIFEVTAPKTIEAAMNKMKLGNYYFQIKKWNEAEKCFRQAGVIMKATAPKLIDAAKNIMNLGNLLQKTTRWTEAEQCFRQAESIFLVIGPNSVDAGHNYWNMGLLFEAIKRSAEAMECFEKAASIYGESGNVELKSEADENIERFRRKECVIS